MRSISNCRLCHSSHLVQVVDLGEQHLTGVFPLAGESDPPAGPLTLLWCADCTLVQLSTTFPQEQMYGANYGYRSGLNASMVRHLSRIAKDLEKWVRDRSSSLFLDIGSNDGTFLSHVSARGALRVGMDPTVSKFHDYYPDGVLAVPDFFSAEAYSQSVDRPADVVTAISMFYDLPDPVSFVQQICSILSADGILFLEQSYLPSMLRTKSYDTICHEHIEYYSLQSIEEVLSRGGMRVLDVSFNRINGGSFALTACKENSNHRADETLLPWFRRQESHWALNTPEPFRNFERDVFSHRNDLKALITSLVDSGKVVMGLGASTKGNVLLQLCGLGPEEIACIGEVNEEKFGRETPGTRIPIVPDSEVRAADPDYLLVLPWHFREGIVSREDAYLGRGGKLIFPLPEIEIVGLQ